MAFIMYSSHLYVAVHKKTLGVRRQEKLCLICDFPKFQFENLGNSEINFNLLDGNSTRKWKLSEYENLH